MPSKPLRIDDLLKAIDVLEYNPLIGRTIRAGLRDRCIEVTLTKPA